MSMDQIYRALSPESLQKILDDDGEAELFLGLRFDSLPTLISFDEVLDRDPKSIRLNQAWQAIDFLLSGRAPDAEASESTELSCIYGGEPTRWEHAYGPVRAFDRTMVSALAERLAAVKTSDLEERFEPERFNAEQLYPGFQAWSAEALPWILVEFEKLRRFFRGAKDRGDAVVTWVE